MDNNAIAKAVRKLMSLRFDNDLAFPLDASDLPLNPPVIQEILDLEASINASLPQDWIFRFLDGGYSINFFD